MLEAESRRTDEIQRELKQMSKKPILPRPAKRRYTVGGHVTFTIDAGEVHRRRSSQCPNAPTQRTWFHDGAPCAEQNNGQGFKTKREAADNLCETILAAMGVAWEWER